MEEEKISKLEFVGRLREKSGGSDFVSISALNEATGLSKPQLRKAAKGLPKIGSKVYLPDIADKLYDMVHPKRRA